IAPGLLRFIDYKTGSDSNKAGNSIANLFQGDHSRNAIFQLLVYAEAYHDLVDPSVNILPALHIIKDIVREGVIAPITYNKAPMQPFPALSDEFRPMLNQLFTRIFDPDEPFCQTTDSNNCRYCPFLSICGRTLPPDFN
ncbi:MAG: PD-(D/E)XK nuclease family protein, partial [Muribaculaceae bacterium]|nr:PD-(D/E)XK nuclease family protein [Muribaculaceae bacterium]